MRRLASIATSHKAIEVLKAAPGWLLVGSAFALVAIWIVPAFSAPLSEDTRLWLPLAAFTTTVLAICHLISASYLRSREHRRVVVAQDRKKLVLLYRPLIALFLTRHVTSCTSVGAPRLRHRIENAMMELSAYRRRSVGMKHAWRALFDRQSSTSAEKRAATLGRLTTS